MSVFSFPMIHCCLFCVISVNLVWLTFMTNIFSFIFIFIHISGTLKEASREVMSSFICFSCSNNDGSTEVKHCVIYHPEGRGYGFRQEGSVFNSLDELVTKHAQTSIKVYFSHMDTCLAFPVFLGRSRGNSYEEGAISSDSG